MQCFFVCWFVSLVGWLVDWLAGWSVQKVKHCLGMCLEPSLEYSSLSDIQPGKQRMTRASASFLLQVHSLRTYSLLPLALSQKAAEMQHMPLRNATGAAHCGKLQHDIGDWRCSLDACFYDERGTQGLSNAENSFPGWRMSLSISRGKAFQEFDISLPPRTRKSKAAFLSKGIHRLLRLRRNDRNPRAERCAPRSGGFGVWRVKASQSACAAFD